MRFVWLLLPFFVAWSCLRAEFPIYDTECDVPHETPIEGDPSFSDDVNLDAPGEPPPGYTPSPSAEQPSLEELAINLKNPHFSSGILSTSEGGIITGRGLRIQARHIAYTNRIEEGNRVQTINAHGDLMMEYGGRAFVGSRLEFDLQKRTGTLWDGKTFVDIWFLGGEKIDLADDGSFLITGAFITTSESQDSSWEIDAHRIKITEEKLLSAKDIYFRFLKVPLFWLPAFKSNLKALHDAPIRYKVVWDKGLGPRLTMRYRIFSWEDLSLFFRLDYRLKRGVGGAFESEYFAPLTNTTFVTRNYGAYDKEFPNEQGSKRYRLQGLYHTESKEGQTTLHVTWDKLSDQRMIADFRSDDFEINTEKRTRVLLQHQIDSGVFNLSVQPRVNRFDSIDQELPLLTGGFRPLPLGNSGILSDNTFSMGILNYVYATDLKKAFHALGLSASTRAVRLEGRTDLYRPCFLGPCTITPRLGAVGILYGNNPDHQVTGQAIASYGLDTHIKLYRQFSTLTHQTEPYIDFIGLTPPTSGLSDHFYFDMQDGFFTLNQMRIGWKNSVWKQRKPSCAPLFSADLYTYGFFSSRAFGQLFPRSYLSCSWNQPSYALHSSIVWNNQEQVWDVTNIGGDFTLSEDVACGIEMRHRSRFDWRKADHSNFLLDVARPIPALEESPLSDGRNTLLTRFFFRLTPKWTCLLQTRSGWGRRDEPAYYAGKIDLTTLLSASWRLKLGYERMPNDNRFTTSISLVK